MLLGSLSKDHKSHRIHILSRDTYLLGSASRSKIYKRNNRWQSSVYKRTFTLQSCSDCKQITNHSTCGHVILLTWTLFFFDIPVAKASCRGCFSSLPSLARLDTITPNLKRFDLPSTEIYLIHIFYKYIQIHYLLLINIAVIKHEVKKSYRQCMTGENNFNNKLFRKKMEFDLFVNSVITASLFSERERAFPKYPPIP